MPEEIRCHATGGLAEGDGNNMVKATVLKFTANILGLRRYNHPGIDCRDPSPVDLLQNLFGIHLSPKTVLIVGHAIETGKAHPQLTTFLPELIF